jgi:branched-chain amino acid transport system permease protein
MTLGVRTAGGAAGLIALAIVPFVASDYVLHIAIQILIWGLIYTAWSMMGRFGLTSFGHGAFLGIGAYVPALLWNYYGVTPWLGIPVGMGIAVLSAVLIGYPSFRLRVVGHYFALVTLALSQVVLLSLVAAREVTGGSLGMTLNVVHSWLALQFAQKSVFYGVAFVFWLVGLVVWWRVDVGIGRVALEAISEDEIAAASSGINVMREKLRVTIISAALTALGGSLLTQYIQYVNPEVVSGVAVSLQIVFAAIAGGMGTLLGPTVGAFFTIVLNESLRVVFGIHFIGAANTIYGILLILFIIFMPQGIVGLIEGISARAVRGADEDAAASVATVAPKP